MSLMLGGSPDDVLDALDASYCTYEGGDSTTFDPTYPDPSGYQGEIDWRRY